jgi:hypothetical protein
MPTDRSMAAVLLFQDLEPRADESAGYGYTERRFPSGGPGASQDSYPQAGPFEIASSFASFEGDSGSRCVEPSGRQNEQKRRMGCPSFCTPAPAAREARLGARDSCEYATPGRAMEPKAEEGSWGGLRHLPRRRALGHVIQEIRHVSNNNFRKLDWDDRRNG